MRHIREIVRLGVLIQVLGLAGWLRTAEMVNQKRRTMICTDMARRNSVFRQRFF